MFICDSSKVGIYYFIFSFFGGLFGFSFSVHMSLELSVPFFLIIEDYYFVCVTSHGLIMLFFFLTIFASGFSNFFIFDFCYLEDMYLKKVNVFGIYVVGFSFFFLTLSLFFGDGVSTGWTLYPPVSASLFFPSNSMELVILSIHLFSFSSLISSMNIMLSFFDCLGKVNSVLDLSVFIISYLLMSFLIMISVPALTSVITLLLFDSNMNTFYFNFEFGGDPVLFQTMFWLFAHPEVYILILPVFGLVSLVMENLCGGEVFNKIGMIFSMFSLFVLSFIVFGHHMVTVGYSLDFSGFFMTSTIVISIPTGVKIFSWLYSLFLFGVSFNVIIGFLSMFMFFFSFGGLTGVLLSNVSLDLIFHDTYFVVGHFHVILGVAAMFGFFSGLFYFFSSFLLCFLNIYIEYFFYLNFFSLCCFLFFPFHFLGVLGFPSSVVSYSFEYFSCVYYINFGIFGMYLCVCFLIVIFLFSFFYQGVSKSLF